MEYRLYRIRKPNGKFRTICAPDDELNEYQHVLLQELQKVPVSPYAHGFVPGRSIYTNAFEHVAKKHVLNLDVKDFFPSLKREVVSPYLDGISSVFLSDDIKLNLKEHCFTSETRGLGQGFCTSPALSNICFIHTDMEFAYNPLDLTDFRYTRYADDLTFSWNGDKPRVVQNLIELAVSKMTRLGLRLNYKKIKHMKRGSRQEVTGLVVNQKVNYPKKVVDAFFLEIRSKSYEDLTEHDRGVLAFLSNVAQHRYQRIMAALRMNGE